MPIITVRKPKRRDAYFCPHCKFVFKKSIKVNEIKGEKNYSYKCTKCKKFFNQDTYKEKCSSGKKYHYIQHSRITVQEKIMEHITKLLLEGESQKSIHDNTHFSRELIDKVLHTYFNQNQKFTHHSFREDYLMDKNILWSDISNAIAKGCSHRIVSKLYGVSNSTIRKALDHIPVTIDYGVKISLDENIIIVKSHKATESFLEILKK